MQIHSATSLLNSDENAKHTVVDLGADEFTLGRPACLRRQACSSSPAAPGLFPFVESCLSKLEVTMETTINKLLQGPLVVINVGLQKFLESLEEQDVDVLQVDWVPPAGGNQELIDLLDQLL
jgi:hypothetical protein